MDEISIGLLNDAAMCLYLCSYVAESVYPVNDGTFTVMELNCYCK
jgi:hypothetical protein